MTMKRINISCPNFDASPIDVEYCIIHYTALDLKQTIDRFCDPKSSVSAHFIIDLDGTIINCVSATKTICHKAWHSGVSRWDEGKNHWQNFNSFSLGIELINLNGNLLPYSNAQYSSLGVLLSELISFYPKLANPARILGHEDVSRFRGKVDPGIMFDWKRVLTHCYPQQEHNKRKSSVELYANSGYNLLYDRDQAITIENSATINTMLEIRAMLIYNSILVNEKFSFPQFMHPQI